MVTRKDDRDTLSLKKNVNKPKLTDEEVALLSVTLSEQGFDDR